MKLQKNELVFLPLGGSNEIGMNVNLYHHHNEWLMIDLGAGFADDFFPGVDMLAPDLTFLDEIYDKMQGLVLTHAHEDHVGSVGYMWHKIRCPIYATPFTAAVARAKLKEAGAADDVKIIEVEPGSSFKVGHFDLEMVQLTHSIPEMNAVVLRTEHGNVVHSGDWKFDPNPVVGPSSDIKKLEALGKEGVLALVCDSTNVFNDRFSGSEGDLLESLIELGKDRTGLLVVTTFASNVARLENIARMAKAIGRKVVLAGWSLKRINQFARDAGYLSDIEPFLTDKDMKKYPRDELLVIATGCQGEPRAQIYKMANGSHPTIRLTPKDTVIFSSKIIPGNEKKIFKLFNQCVRLGCTVFTEKDHNVHVSGHPSREELVRMYDLLKPQIAVPVHGEPTHLKAHTELALEVGVPQAVMIQNGEAVRLAPDAPQSIAHVQTGYLGVDGNLLLPAKGEVLHRRRKIAREGMVVVSVALDEEQALLADPVISAPGVLDRKEHATIFADVKEALIDLLDNEHHRNHDTLIQKVKATTRRVIKQYTAKTPPIEVHVLEVE